MQGTIGFDLKAYIDKKLHSLIKKKRDLVKKFEHHPTLFETSDPEHIKSLEIAFKVKQLQMKEGKIAQIVLGNLPGWEDLKIMFIAAVWIVVNIDNSKIYGGKK